MPNIILTKLKGQTHDKPIKAKIHTFLEKLTESDETLGLHIEPMQNPADTRARTGRVDQSLRAVLYRLEDSGQDRTYVYAGTFEHDEAIERARTRVLKINPVNGVPELIDAGTPSTTADAQMPASSSESSEPENPFLLANGYVFADLTDELGFDQVTATKLWKAPDDEALLAISESLENEWQRHAVLGLAVVDAVAKIKDDLGLAAPDAVDTDPGAPTPDAELLDAFKSNPAAQMTFSYIGDDQDELRRVIESDDFGAWRVFLHPEQRRYVVGDYSGPFRLTGGAGTGKTVVLLHRARQLARTNPDARVLLSTFTRALASNLQRDLRRLDPDIPIADSLGGRGVDVRGIDQLGVAVRDVAGDAFAAAATAVLGAPLPPKNRLVRNEEGWADAITDAGGGLPPQLRHESFFAGEYLQVILPHSITDRDTYFAVRRPGRGVALDRAKRALVWAVIERYRKTARLRGTISFAENASVAAAWLETAGIDSTARVNHVLVDEGQDLTPSHWRLIRALAREGRNDMFLADDSHQRIYGQHVVLSRYGIKTVGRSRRLTLNYRTTEQNLRFAMGVLSGAAYVDAAGESEQETGYKSARRGPDPVWLPTASQSMQIAAVADLVGSWVAEGASPDEIAVLVQARNTVSQLVEELSGRGLAVSPLVKDAPPAGKTVIMTMHSSKGMEFFRVVLFDVSAGQFPTKYVLDALAPEEREDQRLRSRSLLYVAASRARDALVVSWRGERSELLAG